MTGRISKRTSLAAALFFVLLFIPSLARDIDLDALYLKSGSRHYRSLQENKFSLYQKLGSVLVDSGIIHALWASGHELIYVKEAEAVNIVYRYNTKKHQREEIARAEGTITSALMSSGRRYIFLKQITIGPSGMPRSSRLMISFETGTVSSTASDYPFADYSMVPGEDSILYHSARGICEYGPDSGTEKRIIPLSEYHAIIVKDGITVPFYSPNRKKVLVVSGTGGEYSAMVISGTKKSMLRGVSSAGEIFWIDNDRVLFRKGSMGDFSACIHDLRSGKSLALVTGSLNTNISYSPVAKVVTVLANQLLHLYDIRANSLLNCGIEGEDASFSPDGARFVTLISKKLMLTNIHSVKKNGYLQKKYAETLIRIYDNALKDPDSWNNTYTPEYIKKKIMVYRKLL